MWLECGPRPLALLQRVLCTRVCVWHRHISHPLVSSRVNKEPGAPMKLSKQGISNYTHTPENCKYSQSSLTLGTYLP